MQENLECIVLAGGFGTRLQGVIGATPKCMAPVAGQPFLHYLLEYLQRANIRRVVFSLGFLSEQVIDWLAVQKLSFEIDWVVEKEPLGTGGGIRLALQRCHSTHVCVLNGDTFFDLPLQALINLQESTGAETVLGVKHMAQADRYGIVDMNPNGQITAFHEKRPGSSGLINGGVYLIDRSRFLKREFPDSFSFEKGYLEAEVSKGILYGYPGEGYFIDIGVPTDFERAQTEFKILFPA